MIAALRWVNGIVDGVLGVWSGLRTTATFARENWSGHGGATSITQQYPQQKPTIAPAFRGHLFNDIGACITCDLCAKACPVDCIDIVGERNEENKLRPSVFDIDMSKCIYCGLCTRVCPTDCLTFTNDFEVDPVKGYLFRMDAVQVPRRLDSTEVVQLNGIIAKARADRTADDQAFMAGIESPVGTSLVAKFGVGLYTSEQAAHAAAERDKRAAAKKAADAAKAEAAKAAKPAPTSATPGSAGAVPGSAGVPPAPGSAGVPPAKPPAPPTDPNSPPTSA